MLRAFIPLVVVGVVALGVIVAWYLTRDTSVPAPQDTDPATFRNHQNMARILDRLTTDDFVSGVIPDNVKVEINVLLSEYYGRRLESGD